MCVCRSQLTTAKADAHIQQQRLSAAEATAAATAAQLLEVQANLSKARAEAASLQHEADARLAAAKLQCGSCAEKAGQVLELQQQLQSSTAQLREEQQHSKSLAAGLDACKTELEAVKAALTTAQHARDQLFLQLHGSGDFSMAGDGIAALEAPGWKPFGSPARMQLQLVPAEEGLIQRCSNLALQLQQQDVELDSLRQQLLEQQLALSEAQTSCGSAERQLQQAAAELKAARMAAAEATTAAAAARREADDAHRQLQELQLMMAQQQPDLAACKAQVQKLEAQQRVLLGKQVPC